MSPRKTFIDSGVLFIAFRGPTDLANKALEILDDPDREFITSPFVKLEVFPKARYFKNKDEIDFYSSFFDSAFSIEDVVTIVDHAQIQADAFGLAAIDALHIAAALLAGADDLVTGEKPGRPMFRIKPLNVISVRP